MIRMVNLPKTSNMRYNHCKTRILSLKAIKSLSLVQNYTDADFRQIYTEYIKCSRQSLQPSDANVSESDRENASHLASAISSLTTGIAPPVAFPTETVYGLGADATNASSIAGIFSAKGRPSDNPLIVHVSSVDHLERCLGGPIPIVYTDLVQEFWPGPLTILIPVPEGRGVKFAPNVHPGQKTIGFRIPSSVYARFLIAAADRPIAAPSANSSGKPSPTTAQHVLDDLNGNINYILDGDHCDVGVESTVVDGLGDVPLILRPGGLSKVSLRKWGMQKNNIWQHVENGWEAKHSRKRKADEVERAIKSRRLDYETAADMFESPATRSPIGHDLQTDDDDVAAPRAPGMKYKHYAPSGKLYLFERSQESTLSDVKKAVVREFKELLEVAQTSERVRYTTAEISTLSEVSTMNIGILKSLEWPDVREIFDDASNNGGAASLKSLDSAYGGLQSFAFNVHRGDDSTEKLEVRLHCIDLGKTPDAMAQNLFAALRDCDKLQCDYILAEAAPGHECWDAEDHEDDAYETVKERMRKASSKVVII